MRDFKGYLSKGKSGSRREVRLRFGHEGLELYDDAGVLLATWRYSRLLLIEEVYPGQPVRLNALGNKSARLTIKDEDFLASLHAAVPHLRKGRLLGNKPWPINLAWGAAMAVGVVVLVLAVVRLPGMLAPLIPLNLELAMGEAATEEFDRAGLVCSGHRGEKALAHLTDRLAATLETPYTFVVRVVDMPDVNAFAAPGGHVVLFSGLLQQAETPNEVAGVLAHEMAHVVERHATEGLFRGLGVYALFQLLIGDSSALKGVISELGATLVNLSYSRDDEAAADAVAVAMLMRANMRTDGLAGFFERLANKEAPSTGIFVFLSTHPPSEVRAKAVNTAAGDARSAMSKQDWAALKRICA